MSDQQNNQEPASPLEKLEAELARIGEAEEAELTEAANAADGSEAQPDASATPGAGGDGSQAGAGEKQVEARQEEQGEGPKVPLAALKQERQAKHQYKIQAEERGSKIAQLEAEIEALKAGKSTSGELEIDSELLETLEGEGPEFQKLAAQVKAQQARLQELAQQAKPVAKPAVEDSVAQAVEAEEALDGLSWLKGVIDKGGALAAEAIAIDKQLAAAGEHATLRDQYIAVAKELARRYEIPESVVLRGVEQPKTESAVEKVAKKVVIEEKTPDINTLSDLSAGAGQKSASEHFLAMSGPQQQAHLAKMSEDARVAFFDNLIANMQR